MKLTQSVYTLEKEINAKLRALAPERRPELSTRRRAQSVAACPRGFEAMDASGNTESITLDQGIAWLKL
jgi:hypothetical protein